MLTGSKTISERLADEKAIFIEPEILQDALNNVPHISLFTKLKELEAEGVVSRRPSRKFYGATVFIYDERRLKIVPGYAGESKWTFLGEDNFNFHHRCDLAVDPKTKVVLACAYS